MPSEPNFYELLQVDRRASQEVIEAAYHRLAKEYHPDLNKSPGAVEMMQRLNYAHQILNDPRRREQYDRWLFGTDEKEETEKGESKTGRPATPQPIACENCGRVDETLRATVFTYVISVLVLSFKRGAGAGILCSSCRTSRSIGYTLLSILLGPWGLPWGIIWTIEAVSTNLSGGKQPAGVNGPLLRAMGAYFWSIGFQSQAIAAFKASLRFEKNKEVSAFLERASEIKPQSTPTKNPKTSSQSIGAPIAVIGVTVGVVICLCAVAALAVLDSVTSPSENAINSASAPTAASIRPVSTNVPTRVLPTLPQQPEPTPTLAPVKAWVCVDLAYGYARPDTNSPVVFQMSQQDGWSVWVYELRGNWYTVGNGNAPAYMESGTLCKDPPQLNWTAIDAQRTATAAEQKLCSEYKPPSTDHFLRYVSSGQLPILGIVRTNGIKVYFDIADAEYWDPNEKGDRVFFQCPAAAEKAGFVVVHPK